MISSFTYDLDAKDTISHLNQKIQWNLEYAFNSDAIHSPNPPLDWSYLAGDGFEAAG